MTKKKQILHLLDSTNDSHDLIALQADCALSYVKKIESDREKARQHLRNNPRPQKETVPPLTTTKGELLQDENDKLKRLLHDLTPGGSEFYNDPEYCAQWIRENRQQHHYSLAQQIVNLKDERQKLLDSNNELRGALLKILNLPFEPGRSRPYINEILSIATNAINGKPQIRIF